MATNAVLPSRDVQTTLNYYSFTGNGKPYRYVGEPPAGVERKNFETVSHPATIYNARGLEDELTLDKAGFQFLNSPSVEREFDDEERIKAQYYPEVEELLKRVTGAKRVLIFDHTIRRKLAEGTPDGPGNRGPGLMSTPGPPMRIASSSRACRVRIINVWRPIHHPVAHFPLAVSDWRTLDTKDLIAVDLVYPTRRGETYGVRHNPAQKWYYLVDQTPDEVTLIKCYDSQENLARLTPHTAFQDGTSPKDAPHRESIEIRALVFDAE
ncbi:uncharacterized protein BXZ73DRAFT_98904 [Epithele typhae]|uniref:uncharacterized protein n=1 Tax=Epithele typhae TaxID=378194 RepID=UPI0020084D25|nr:uncharacterized protein BXZ73DRAFT_98904 [Epithele typhae]KAH9940475.1 hypothetical protein BXZ73DRAFT_98904 [Epithele typhae]